MNTESFKSFSVGDFVFLESTITHYLYADTDFDINGENKTYTELSNAVKNAKNAILKYKKLLMGTLPGLNAEPLELPSDSEFINTRGKKSLALIRDIHILHSIILSYLIPGRLLFGEGWEAGMIRRINLALSKTGNARKHELEYILHEMRRKMPH